MQTVVSSPTTLPSLPADVPAVPKSQTSAYVGYQIIRRNGAVVVFEPNKIAVALMKAFLAVHGTQGAASASVRETVEGLTESVVRALLRSRPGGGTFHIEDVQDHVELGLMRGGHHEVARAYVLYRERRSQERAKQKQVESKPRRSGGVTVIDRGQRVPLDEGRLQSLVESACAGLGADVKAEPILAETRRNLYDGVPIDEVYKASILAARTLIEKEPAYTRATARLLLHTIRSEILGEEVTQAEMGARYAEYFPGFIKKGIEAELLDEKLAQYDLARLGAALQGRARPAVRLPRPADPVRPLLPAHRRAAHRAAAGLLHARGDGPGAERDRPRGARHRVLRSAVELRLHESARPRCSTPARSARSCSSCYLTTVADDLDGIYEALKENALLSKFAGGLGNDWTNVRALGSYIKGTNGKSQGVVPFLKVVNDTAVAVNQGGKRKGAVCAYLETWHLDIEEFLELRKNTGDDRRRTPRHEHRELDSGPVHEARDGRRRLDPVLAVQPAPTCTTSSARTSRLPTWPTKPRPTAARSSCSSACRPRTCGARCCRCCSRPGIPGSPSRTPAMCAARSSMWAWCTRQQPVHRDHAQHQRQRDRGVQPRQREPGAASEGRRGRPGQAEEDRSPPRCACSTT